MLGRRVVDAVGNDDDEENDDERASLRDVAMIRVRWLNGTVGAVDGVIVASETGFEPETT